MPHFTTNSFTTSPFAVRVRPGRRREETGHKSMNMKNPSMTGQSSTSSTASSARYALLRIYYNELKLVIAFSPDFVEMARFLACETAY